MIKQVSMGGYEINTPGKAEFQGFGSQEELDAAIKLGGLKEDNNSLSLQEKSQKGAMELAKITRSLGGAGTEELASEVAGKNTPKTVNKVLTKALDGNKKKTEKVTDSVEKSSLDASIADWEDKVKISQKELSQKQSQALQNLDSLEIKDRNLIVSIIDDLEDKIEEYNREYTDAKNFDKTKQVSNKELDYYDYLENEINQKTQDLTKVREKYTQLFQKGLTLTDSEKQDVRGMDAGDFLRKYSREERLKFVTFSGEEGNVGKVDSLTFTFSYDGVFNRELYTKLTAGQVLPKDVASVKYGDVEYRRSSLLGEFFNANGKRLKIGEGTNITDIQYRSAEEITSYENGLEKKLENLPDNLKDNIIAQEAVKRGIEPQLFIDIVGDAINSITNKDYRRAALEEELTSFERFKGTYGVGADKITTESIKSNDNHKRVIAALFNQVNGKEQGWHGEREFAKKNGYESVYKQSLQSLEKNYGISSEVLGETTLGKRIVDHLKRRNYRPYEGQAYNCGKNVGEALRAIGIVGQGIPRGGRHGYKWAGFMEQRPDFQKSPVDARNAPAGSIISYQPVKGKGSGPRQQYGHVEIALGNGKYWFGATANNPGGSYRNPPRGTYEVFVPKGSSVEAKGIDENKDKDKKLKEVKEIGEKFNNLDSSSLVGEAYSPELKDKVTKNFDTIKRGAAVGFDRLGKKGVLSSKTPVTVYSLNQDRSLSTAFHYFPDTGKIKAYPVGYGIGIGAKEGSNKTPLGSFKVGNIKIAGHDVDVSNSKTGTIMGNRSVVEGLDGDVNKNSKERYIYTHGVVMERGKNISKGNHGDGTYNKESQSGVSKGCRVMETQFAEEINADNKKYAKFGAYEEVTFTSGTTVYTGSDSDKIKDY